LRSRTNFRRYQGRRVPFSCFALPDSFSEVPRASGPVFKFCAPGLVFYGSGWRRVQFSCFVLPNSFSAEPWASGPIFMFCAHKLIFGNTVGVGSRFHVLAHLDSFSAVPWVSGPFLMFCAAELVFGGTEGVVFGFQVLLSWTHFRWYLGRWVLFSCFVLPDSFSAVPRASGAVFMFCAPKLVFGGNVGINSFFHVLRSQTRFRRYRGRWVLFSCFALLVSFLTVPGASCPVFMFCAPEIDFGGTVDIRSRF
jgi:hypothetical protein